MSDRNWEAEMAKIDKQLASVSDEALLAENKAVGPSRTAGRTVAAPTASAPARAATTASPALSSGGTWKAWMKVSVAVGAAAGLMFWPWPARCGPALVGFTAATVAVAVLGMWSAIGTWKHRLGLAHFASLLVIVWGLVLGARELLPRVGYAVPTEIRTAGWSCEGVSIPVAQPTVIGPTAIAPANGLPR